MKTRRGGKIGIVIVFLVAVAAFVGMMLYQPKPPVLPVVEATINGTTFHLYAPTTPRDKEVGLAAYSSIKPDQGMIFRGLPEGVQTFWMKNMKFDIDIIWVNRDNQIVHIVYAVSKDSYPKRFENPIDRPAAYTIELPSGACDSHGIAPGAIVTVR